MRPTFQLPPTEGFHQRASSLTILQSARIKSQLQHRGKAPGRRRVHKAHRVQLCSFASAAKTSRTTLTEIDRSNYLEALLDAARNLPRDKARAIDTAVEASFEAMQVPFVKRLVECSSWTGAKEDVEKAAEIVDEVVEKELGLSKIVHHCEFGKYASHRVYSTPSFSGVSAAVGLVGHVDTVYPRSLGFLNFTREQGKGHQGEGVGGDLIRGPGVYDMKGGVSCILFSLKAVKTLLEAPAVVADPAFAPFAQLPVRWICNTDEENGSPSSCRLSAALAPSLLAALVLEGGRPGDAIVQKRKGLIRYRLTCVGRPAHSGNSHAEGVSAVHALALLVPRLEELTEYQGELAATVNVGTFAGGSTANTVPGRAEVEIDVRFATKEAGQCVAQAIQGLVTRARDAMPSGKLRDGVEFTLETTAEMAPMEETANSRLLKQAYVEGTLRGTPLGLGSGDMELVGGASDGNVLSGFGVPCIDSLGPFGGGMHELSEWSSLSSLLNRTKALARLMLSLSMVAAEGNAGPEGKWRAASKL